MVTQSSWQVDSLLRFPCLALGRPADSGFWNANKLILQYQSLSPTWNLESRWVPVEEKVPFCIFTPLYSLSTVVSQTVAVGKSPHSSSSALRWARTRWWSSLETLMDHLADDSDQCAEWLTMQRLQTYLLTADLATAYKYFSTSHADLRLVFVRVGIASLWPVSKTNHSAHCGHAHATSNVEGKLLQLTEPYNALPMFSGHDYRRIPAIKRSHYVCQGQHWCILVYVVYCSVSFHSIISMSRETGGVVWPGLDDTSGASFCEPIALSHWDVQDLILWSGRQCEGHTGPSTG